MSKQSSANSSPVRLSRSQSRRVDEIAINEFGIPGIVLMENAGRASADFILANTSGPVLICCGHGNNGGDGFVIARHLAIAARTCSVLFVGDEAGLADDARVNFDIVRKMRIPFAQVDTNTEPEDLSRLLKVDNSIPGVVVEAMLGTGANGAPRFPVSVIVASLNQSRLTRIAIDCPAGLDCDSGKVHQPAFNANTTLTFVAAKTGFFQNSGPDICGEILVIGIGLPAAVIETARRE